MTESHRKIEKMENFFDQRAEGYDGHMRDSIESFQAFYEAIASPIKPGDRKIKVLDLGSGTGLALKQIIDIAPRAEIIAVDISEKMLGKLLQKYQRRRDQIHVIMGSYLDLDFPPETFDYVISVMTLHHLHPEQKVSLYEDICRWLKGGGTYIEGDYIVSGVKEEENLQAYQRVIRRLRNAAPGLYHVDIPLSLETQYDLLTRAGFEHVETLWHEEQAAVLVAEPAK